MECRLMVEWYNNEGDTSYLFQSFDERTRPLCKKISTSIFSLRSTAAVARYYLLRRNLTIIYQMKMLCFENKYDAHGRVSHLFPIKCYIHMLRYPVCYIHKYTDTSVFVDYVVTLVQFLLWIYYVDL